MLSIRPDHLSGSPTILFFLLALVSSFHCERARIVWDHNGLLHNGYM